MPDIFLTLFSAAFLIYLLAWGNSYLQLRSVEERITGKLQQLSQVNIPLSLQTSIRPKLSLEHIELDVLALQQLETSLDTMISGEGTRLALEQEELTSSVTDLEETVNRLGIMSALDTQSDSNLGNDAEQDFLEIYSKVSRLRLNRKALKDEITNDIVKRGDRNEFTNPLWVYAANELPALVNNMSPETKAAQLLMFSINGTSLTEADKSKLRDWGLGGVILMGGNISSAQQLAGLTREIKKNALELPPLIATDQEGGVVKRVGWDRTSGAKSWEALQSEEICSLSTERARILKAGGINLNLAPVTDLSYPGAGYINNRTISADPDEVARVAGEFVNCSQREGVATTLKHFPGHGGTAEDSHITLPVIAKSLEEWKANDALPFRENLDSSFIMSGHLLMEAIDKDNPASLSHTLLTDILRNEFGYKGLIITDDMQQLQVATGMDYKKALKGTLLAGTDVVLYVGYPASKEDIYQETIRLITSGELPQEELNAKILRILNHKRLLDF